MAYICKKNTLRKLLEKNNCNCRKIVTGIAENG
jgi:hypothetical protein